MRDTTVTATRPFARPLVNAALIVGLSLGALSANADVIVGCKKDSTGALRIVDTVANCGNNEIAVYWNVEGPPGPQGEQGPPGPGGARSGAVSRNGDILAGEGFTVTKLGTGSYRITLDPFLGSGFAIPVVTSFEGVAGDRLPYVNLVGGSFFDVKFFERTTPAPTLIDSQFTFIVMDSAAGGPAAAAAAVGLSTSSTPEFEADLIAAP
jgi:hypothetical protein